LAWGRLSVENRAAGKGDGGGGGDDRRDDGRQFAGGARRTWLGHQFSWRYTFLAIAVFDIAVLVSIAWWVPTLFDKSTARLRSQFFLNRPRRG
jgi:hypothetical protein